MIGERQRARDLMDRLLRIASPLASTPRSSTQAPADTWGNFPQAFSHLALIQAASGIILGERLKEFGINT